MPISEILLDEILHPFVTDILINLQGNAPNSINFYYFFNVFPLHTYLSL